MPAPNAASLGKYTDMPVSYFTGVPSIGVPIYTVSEGPLNLPISLGYHASGIRVGETAGWVGTGWSLSAGGVITRTVLGTPDEEGYYLDGANLDYPANILDNIIDEVANGAKDAEPDLFSFNFAGYSGKFMIGADHTAFFIPQQDLKLEIDFSDDNKFRRFTITDPQGTRYIFGNMPGSSSNSGIERTATRSAAHEPVIAEYSSWYLVRIESFDQNHWINLSYTDEFYGYKNLSTCNTAITYCESQGAGGMVYSSTSSCSGIYNLSLDRYVLVNNIYGKRLTGITTGNTSNPTTPKTTVEFFANTLRENLDPNDLMSSGNYTARSLDRIKVASGPLCSHWDFSYSYFKDLTFSTGSGSKRLKLDSVTQVSCDQSQAIPPFVFAYYGEVNSDGSQRLPNRLSKAIDGWGFYNGASANENEYLNIPPTEVMVAGGGFSRGNSNRSSNEEKMIDGTLSSITYPTGGTITYQYGAHKISNMEDVTSNQYFIEYLGNCAFPAGSCCSNTQVSQNATLTSITGKFRLRLETVPEAEDPGGICFNGSTDFYARIEVKSGSTVVGQYTLDFNPFLQEFKEVELPISNLGGSVQANVNYQFVLTVINGRAEFSIYGQTTAPQTLTEEVGGLRVESIELDPGTGPEDVIERTFEYTVNDNNTFSSGVLYQKPLYGASLEAGDAGSSLFHVVFEAQSIVPLGNIDGSHIGYERVVENHNGNGRIIHYFRKIDNSQPLLQGVNDWDGSQSHLLIEPPAWFLALNGSLDSTVVLNASDAIMSKTANTYDHLYKYFPGIAFKIRKIPVDCGSTGTFPPGWSSPIPNAVVLYRAYTPRTGASYLTGTSEYLDGVTKNSTYQFNLQEGWHHNPISIGVVNSDGVTHSTELDYAHERNNTFMLQKNILGIPIAERRKTGGQLAGGKEFTYTNGYPMEMKEILKDGSLLLRGSTSGYQNGRPNDFTQRGYSLVDYQWQNDQLTGWDYNAWHKGFEYYTNSQFLKKVTDIDGQQVEYIYDALGRLHKIKSRSGNIETTFAYQFGAPNSVTTTTVYSDAPTQTVIQEFDGLGRVTKEYLNGVLKHEYRYDQYNRIEEETYLPGNFTNYQYDGSPLNRVIRQNYPDYSFTRTEYGAEGNYYKVSTYDEKGNKTDNITDILGRQYKIRNALSGVTLFEYDERSNLDQVTSPAGRIYTYEYDLRNRLIFKKMPGQDKGQVFGYFDDDLMEFSIDGNGARIDYEYDVYKRNKATYLNTTVTNWIFPNQNYGTKGSLITSNTWYPDAGGAITVNKLKESLVKMADLNGQVTTHFDEYDAFGRLKKQREVYPLLQKASNTDQIEFTYNHADWLLREKRIHGGYTPLTTYRDHSYDEFGRMIFDGLFPDFSFETGLVYNMTYNDRDQMTTKKLGGISNPLDKVRFSYTERGWLSQMNDLIYRQDAAAFCEDPPSGPGTIAIEQTVDFEDLIDLVVSEPTTTIGPTTPCTFPPCYEIRASYDIQVIKPADPVGSGDKVLIVDACIEALYGENGPVTGYGMSYPYCLFGENESNQFKLHLENWLTQSGYAFEAVSVGYNAGQQTYTISVTNTNFVFVDVDVKCRREYRIYAQVKGQNAHIEGMHASTGPMTLSLSYPICNPGNNLVSPLQNWLNSQGYTYGLVRYYSNPARVVVTKTDWQLDRIEYCYECITNPGDTCESDPDVLYPSALCLGSIREYARQAHPCKNPKGINPGTDTQQPGSVTTLDQVIAGKTVATVPLPNVLYEVELLDGSIRWVFEDELSILKGGINRATRVPVTAANQTFEVKRTNGQTVTVDLAGLLDERETGNVEKISPINPAPCGPYPPLGCTESELAAQAQSLGQIQNAMTNLDVNDLQYPLQLTLVRLCDGSTAYILQSLLGDLEGPYVVLGNITVTGPDQTFQVLATPKEPIFAMIFNHEANGNIKRAEWQVTYNQPQYYDYAYDVLNRLTSGLYGRVVPLYNLNGVFTKFSHILNNNYNENNLTYDADGNISTLNRFGMVPNASCFTQAQIDVLSYTYIAGTPKLQKVTDTAPSANRAKGFNPGTASGSAVYVYDKNGNLITDPYKGITIQYNFLNLPRLVTKGGANIAIRYDASGRKWSQSGTEGIREYVGGIEYVDQKIQSVQHGEGRLVATYNASGTAIESIRAEYWRQDHLGNTRVAFSDFNLDGVIATKDDPGTTENEVEITQENHYYPFGLNHEGPWYQTVQPKNKYQFNGIERVEDLGINLDLALFRSYDPAVGRWWQVDPLAEFAPDWTPYRFGLDNPVLYADPFGLFETRREAKDFKEEQGIKGKVRRDGETYYIQERGEGGGQYAFGTAAGGYDTKEAATARAFRISEVGVGAALEMEENNPNVFFKNSFGEQAYIWGYKFGFALPSARIVTAGKTATTGASQAAKGSSRYLYHYTSSTSAQSISRTGFTVTKNRPFIYATNTGKLSPLQAQIELALPANRALPNSLIRIDAAGLRRAGINPIIGPRRVQGNLPGLGAGGGTEFIFNQNIPSSFIKIIR